MRTNPTIDPQLNSNSTCTPWSLFPRHDGAMVHAGFTLYLRRLPFIFFFNDSGSDKLGLIRNPNLGIEVLIAIAYHHYICCLKVGLLNLLVQLLRASSLACSCQDAVRVGTFRCVNEADDEYLQQRGNPAGISDCTVNCSTKHGSPLPSFLGTLIRRAHGPFTSHYTKH